MSTAHDDETLAPYRSPQAREAAFEALAGRLGAELRVLGESVEGRPIRAARVAPSSPSGQAQVLVCAAIHGVEYIATEVALGLLEALCAPDEALAALHARAAIWVVPCLNPDAYARTWAQGGHGALKALRANAHGVDLNRNFPLPAPQRGVWFSFGGWRTGSDDPQNPFYRGPAPLSEPEAAALAGLLDEVRFGASVSLHSTMGTVIPPCVREREDYRAYGELCAVLRRAQARKGYRRMANFRLDRFTGELEDYQHARHGTWAVCIEHWPLSASPGRFLRRGPLFWRFNPPDPRPWVDNDVPGIVAFLNAALDRPTPASHVAGALK